MPLLPVHYIGLAIPRTLTIKLRARGKASVCEYRSALSSALLRAREKPQTNKTLFSLVSLSAFVRDSEVQFESSEPASAQIEI